MSKAASAKKTTSKAKEKVPASNAKKDAMTVQADKENPSKYAPSGEVTADLLQLDPKDGVMKLLVDSLKDLYWAENCLVKALPKIAKSASSGELKDAIMDHLEETKTHVARLEQAFELLNVPAQAKKCDAMEGLTKEGEAVIETTDNDSPARDLGIIMGSQKVEHYEISAYTGLAKLADKLGLPDVSALLNETLAEEEAADAKLAAIADSGIDF